MDELMKLKEIYRLYEQQASQVRQESKGFGGIWGMGEDHRSNPCHDAFYKSVGQWVHDYLNTNPDGAGVMTAAQWILGAADTMREKEAFWYVYAAQRHVMPMIPWLTGTQCKQLADWYDAHYTKLERLPVQRELYKKLCKAAKSR